MEIKPLKNKSGQVLTNADTCRWIRTEYDNAYKAWKDSGVRKPFKSPLGGRCDNDILAFCDAVLKQPTPQQQQDYFQTNLTNLDEFIASGS